MRLDVYAAEYWPEHSRSTWQKYIEKGLVKVNGKIIYSTKYLLDEDDVVTIDALPKPQSATQILPVLYEDNNVIVIDKPVGVLTHAKGAVADEFTVADFIKSRTHSNDEAFMNSNRTGIVHRLDRATSGILIAAKNPETQTLLQKQFANRKAHKTYQAIVEKAPKLPIAKIDLPIGRNPKKPSSFRIDAKGKPAITNYETTKILKSGAALLELKPVTGRTHQLRVHLAHIGSPILGDSLYGSGKVGQRMFLHAKSLEITIPGKDGNRRVIFEAPLPNDFKTKLASLEHS